MRWSNTKLPLSEPATRRSEGSHWRRSASAKISSSDSSRSSGGTDAGTHSHSASKWQSSVSVSRRAGPSQRGQLVLHELARARRAGCRCRSGAGPAAAAPAAARAARAPCRTARSRRSGSACPRSAGARSRSRTRDSARPARACGGRGAPWRRGSAASSRALARSARLGPRADRSRVAARSPHRCGRATGIPSTTVGPKRESTSGETSSGSLEPSGAVEHAPGVDHRDRLRLAGAALPAARAQLLELLVDARSPTPTRPPLGGGETSARSVPRASASA